MNDLKKTHKMLFDVSCDLDDVVSGIEHAVKTMYYALEEIDDQSVRNDGCIEHFSADKYEHILLLCADRIFAEKGNIEKLSQQLMDIAKHNNRYTFSRLDKKLSSRVFVKNLGYYLGTTSRKQYPKNITRYEMQKRQNR